MEWFKKKLPKCLGLMPWRTSNLMNVHTCAALLFYIRECFNCLS